MKRFISQTTMWRVTRDNPDQNAPPQHAHKLKVIFQNINGWIGKKEALQQIYTELNPDIILFAHTNIAPPRRHINIHPYITYMHNTGNQSSGVAILIKPNITHSKITHEFHGETLAIKI